MAAINAIRLPKESPFKKANQVPLPEDPVVGVQTEEQEEDSSDDDEGSESPESRELSRQIDSHIVVIDDEQPRIGVSMSEQTTQPMVTSDPPPSNPSIDQEAPVVNLVVSVTPAI